MSRRSRQLTCIITLVVCAVGTARLVLLLGPQVDHGNDKQLVEVSRAVQTGPPDQASVPGIGQIQPYRFSDMAAVILTYGPDGEPGQASIDDNRDGIIDNKREIGAVGSDDECLAPWDANYQSARALPGTVIISRGTYVPLPEDAPSHDTPQRLLWEGKTNGQTRTWLLMLDD